jgi:hypothetical protein
VRQRGAGSCHAAGVQNVCPLFLGDVHDGKDVAPDPDHHGFDDIERRGGGDRCIDCIAAMQEDLQSRLCGQRLTGHHHAVLCQDFGAGLCGPALRARPSNGAAKRRMQGAAAGRCVERNLRAGAVGTEPE